MRIIGGNLKGSKLLLPNNKITRPLKDLARESIFNLLEHSNKISFNFSQTEVLDIFAGTGSFGLECLSRQSEFVYFVEKENDAFEVLKQNIKKLKLDKKTKIFNENIFDLLKKKNIFNKKFNLIFFDPPFKMENLEILIEYIYKNDLLKKDGIVVLHRNKNTIDKFPDYFKSLDNRIYGKSKIIFGKFL